jgi:hypothetical protein
VIKKTVLLAALVLGVVSVSFAQRKFAPPPTGQVESEAYSALTTTGGKIVVNFTISIQSYLGGDPIGCQVGVYLVNGSSYSVYTEEDGGSKATVSGSTATCTVTIPYSWQVQNSTDIVGINAMVVSGPASPSATNLPICASSGNGYAACVYGFPGRISGREVGTTFLVPPNGTTTTRSVALTF